MLVRASKVLVCILFVLGVAKQAGASGDGSAFMLVSGISSSEEMCVAVSDGTVDTEGAQVNLEPCASAIAAGDGRELWQRLPNGQVANVIGKKCVGASGDVVVLTTCDTGCTWETQKNGQFKLAHPGGYCLSQKGVAVGEEDVAARGAIAASSTADAAAHGANMAVDGRSNTFWASGLDPTGPATIAVDFSTPTKLVSVWIEWEFFPKTFSVSISTDGTTWSEIYATDSNVLSSNRISLHSARASKLRIVMRESFGSFHGHSLYAMKSLVVRATRLHSIVEDCTAAAKSTDARDKYFATYVDQFAPCSSKALRSELPSLFAARASVASVVSELADVLPKLGSCHKASLLEKKTGLQGHLLPQSGAMLATNAHSLWEMPHNVDIQNGIDAEGVATLLNEARRVIIAARGALF